MPPTKAKLEELVTCAVCLEPMKEPKMLPCQHTFCRGCVQRCASAPQKEAPPREGAHPRLRCAQCRTEAPLPKGGVEALPANIYAQSLIDWIKTGESESHCHGCSTACEVRECEHCTRFFCTICEQRHLSELQLQLRGISEQLEAAKLRLAHKIKAFVASCDRVKECVHREVQRRVREILDQESELVGRVDAACGQERAACAEMTHRLQVNGAAVAALLEGDFDVAETPREKVSKFMSVHKDSSDCMAAAEGATFEGVLFDPETLTISGRDAPPAEALVTSSTEGRSGGVLAAEERDCAVDQVEVKPKRAKQQDDDNAQSLIYRSKSFVARACIGSSFLQRPSGVAVSPWSKEVYVVSMDTHKVHVFDLSRGKFLRSFGSRGQKPGEFLCPYGIALSSASQQILVSDKWKNCLHLFGRDERFVRQVGGKGGGPGQFRSPESLCVDRQGLVYVCDTINNRIQVLDKDCVYLREIDGQVPLRGAPSHRPRRALFQEPAGIAVSPDGAKVVVCDFGHHRIHVFSREGAPLLTCGQKGALRGQFNNPECVAVDEHGFIFVGDSGNCRVQILRPDGRFVRTFGCRGGPVPGHFSWISGLAVAPGHGLVVCDYKNHSLQIF